MTIGPQQYSWWPTATRECLRRAQSTFRVSGAARRARKCRQNREKTQILQFSPHGFRAAQVPRAVHTVSLLEFDDKSVPYASLLDFSDVQTGGYRLGVLGSSLKTEKIQDFAVSNFDSPTGTLQPPEVLHSGNCAEFGSQESAAQVISELLTR